MRLTLTTTSLDDRGNFFGRTCNRGFGDASFFEGEIGRVGDLELRLTRLVFPFKLPMERVCTPSPGPAFAGDPIVAIFKSAICGPLPVLLPGIGGGRANSVRARAYRLLFCG